MHSILSDTSKFTVETDDLIKLNTRLEDSVNNLILSFKKFGIHIPNDCKATGSHPGKLYGLPKTHKANVPLRPVLSAYTTASFNLAKYIVKLLNPIAYNEYSVKNSYDFINDLSNFNFRNGVLVNFDVESLFTAIPVEETINIILDELFISDDTLIENMNRKQFKRLLKVATDNTYFLFNCTLYKQVDGMAMGSPLGPVFANVFMNKLEREFMLHCPCDFKPKFYKRYVDDTFTIFDSHSQALKFLEYINNRHPNIKFTVDFENNDKISFLDILIHKNETLEFSVYRKTTFTGLSINFFSFCPIIYKINALKTLLFRSYSICSNLMNFHKEIEFLHDLFVKNQFPLHLAQSITKKFLNNIFSPSKAIHTVPKKDVFVSIPYFGYKSDSLKANFSNRYLSVTYPSINFKIVLNNNLRIGSFFNCKDKTMIPLCSGVIYSYK